MDQPTPESRPPWPWWYGPVGFVVAVIATLLVSAIVLAVVDGVAELTGGGELDANGAEFTVIGTFIQDAVLIATAIVLASQVTRVRPSHFGLRATRLAKAVGLTFAAWVIFVVIASVYQVIFDPGGEQTVAEDIGADQSNLGLVAGAVLVIVIAPFTEEFFFRGFFYGALRTKLSVWPAALIDGVVFGAIHITSSETLPLVPVLGILGVIFCLLYERTGSLFAPIALHAVNNTIAYIGATHGKTDESVGVPVSIGLAVAMLAACVLAPRGLSRPATA
jgi:uncharacterized protein